MARYLRRGGVLALVLLLMLAAQPAQAAGPTLAVSIGVASAQPILAGNMVTWNISWQCSSLDATPCTGARLDVTRPQPTVGGSAVGSPGFTTAAFVNTLGAHFVFVDPLPAGSSGTLQLQYQSVNLRTPNGTILAPVATFQATNASSVQASAGAEIAAATHLAVTKRRLAQAEPWVGIDVTYEINVFDSSIPNNQNPPPGAWSVVDAVVTDMLPPDALFISATGGGVYDSATHSVTWPAIGVVDNFEARCRAFGLCLYVTINYPPSKFIADGDPANPSDEVTNHVQVVGKPAGLPGGADVVAQGSVAHGFGFDMSTDAVFQKNSFVSGSRGGKEASYSLLWGNRSTFPARFIALDRLPCQVVSPNGPLVPCLTPGFRLTRFRLTGPVIGAPVVIEYTTNQGNSGRLSFPAAQTIKSPGVDDDLPRTFNDQEFVSHLTIDADLAGGFTQGLDLFGTIDPNFPDDPATEVDLMRNCAQTDFFVGEFPPLAPVERCDDLAVIAPKPLLIHRKTGISLSAVAPTEARTFALHAQSCGDRAWHPVFTDLLPANLRYVPGSQTSNQALYPSLGGVAPTFEAIDNYNASGRQLLRWSWPGGQVMSECNELIVSFQARVEAGTPPGTYTNAGQFFDATFTNTNTPLTNICSYVEQPDEGDYDGDGDTGEYRCISTYDYTVVETASMVATKEVRGSYDAEFNAAPAVGLVDPGKPAEYRITLQNTGNVSLTNLLAYDILPFVGDTGVSGTQLGNPRGSQWQPLLAGAVTPPPGGTVEYSLSANPCRGEVIAQGGAPAAGPPGCVNDWTTAPASFSAVRALRVDLGSTVLAGAESRSVIVPMTAPLDVDGIAWNTVALAGRRAGTDDWLLPTEPPKVGLAAAAPDLAISKDDGRTSVTPGATLTYTVVVHNAGNQRARGVVISDTLPLHTSFVAASGGGSAAGGTVTWPPLELAGGATATHTVTIQLDAQLPDGIDAITNTVVVADDGQKGADPLPSNNTATDVDAINRSPATCRIYAVQDAGRRDSQFFTIELAGNTIEPLGPLHAGLDVEALALHPVSNILYAAGRGHGGKHLLIVDTQSGALAEVGRIGFHDVDSLAFRPSDATLWGWARGVGLIQIDPSTGAGTLVLKSTKDIQDLAWSGDGGQLYAVSDTRLYRYDPIAKKLTQLAVNLPGETEGLAMRPDGLLALGVDGAAKLYAYDVDTRQLVPSQEVAVGVYDDVEGIAWPAACSGTP